jgi:hypothetical protein
LGDIVPTDHVWEALIAGVPAMLTLYAWLVRVPAARAFVRSVWRNGRVLLTASAALHVALVTAAEWPSLHWAADPAASAPLLGDLLVAGYVMSSARVKDTFLDFPVSEGVR